MKSTVANIQTDANTLTGCVNTFDTDLAAFVASPGISSFVTVAMDTQAILVAGKQAIADAQALPHPLSITDAATLATILTPLAATCASALAAVAAAQPQIAAIPMVGGIAPSAVLGVLMLLQSLSVTFETAILAAVPSLAQAPLLAAQTTLNNAFSAAIASF